MLLNKIYQPTGPLENTVGDFWQMIIEYKLPTIVMLTKTFERDTVRQNLDTKNNFSNNH